MRNIASLQNIRALGSKGGLDLFNPDSISGLLFDSQSLSGRQLISKKGNQTRPVQQGRAYLFDGTDDIVDCPDIGTVDTFEGYVEFAVDNQEIWTLANTTATALTVASGVLTAGASLTIATIFVDGVSKTASEAGVLLNDNVMRLLRVTFTSAIATSDLRLGTNGSAFGNLKGAGWKFSNGATERAFYKMDEQAGTVAYDSSGNGNSGTITNATLSTFHSTQTVYSYQNQIGYNMMINGFASSANLNTSWSLNGITVPSIVQSDPFGGTTANMVREDGTTGNHRFFQSFSWVAGQRYTISVYLKFVGRQFVALSPSDPSLGATILCDLVNGTIVGTGGTFADSGVENVGGGWYRFWLTKISGGTGASSPILYGSSTGSGVGTTSYAGLNADAFLVYGLQIEIGSLSAYVPNTTGAFRSLIPRNEANITNDVLGRALDFSGKAKLNATLKGSNCITLNGSTQLGTLGNIGNINRFRGYVRLAVDNQTILSLANTTATAFSVSGAVLTAGASLALGVIKIGTNENDLATVTASEAGIELNLNAFLFIEINFTTFNATDVRLGLANTTFGNVNFAGVTTSLAGVAVSDNPIAEGFGVTSYDVSGNGRNITWVNAPTWSTQDIFHYNIRTGFNKYMAWDGSDDYVSIPIVTGSVTNATIELRNVIVTGEQGTLLTSGTLDLNFLGSTENSGSTGINGGSGSPTTSIDGVAFTGSRLALRTLLSDGLPHTVRWVGVNLTGWTQAIRLGWYDAGPVYRLEGTMSDVTFDLTSDGTVDHRYNGYGTANADWTDQVGSVNGTVVGSPVPIRIPKLTSANTDAFTRALRNIPLIAGRNDAETAIDFRNITELGNVPPEMQHLAVSVNFTAFTFGRDTGWDTYDYAFYRQFNSVANDRFLIYAQNLTGANLAKAKKYTNNT